MRFRGLKVKGNCTVYGFLGFGKPYKKQKHVGRVIVL